MSVGERIKLIRKSYDLTQVQFAEKLDLKQATIGRYESSSINPSVEALLRISNKLHVNLGWLLTGRKGEEDGSKSNKYKCPEIVKIQETDRLVSTNIEKLHRQESTSVIRRKKIIKEVNELRKVALDLTYRIISLQEELRKGL